MLLEIIEQFQIFFSDFFLVLKIWWWIFPPVLLYFIAEAIYLYWIQWDCYYAKNANWVLLELIPPREIEKPFMAMEDLYTTVWGLYDGPQWHEKWCQGELPLGGGLWFSFEIASFGGEIHFYIRVPDFFRDTMEAALYSHYPDLEIKLVDDYVKNVPQDIPNDEWDLKGENYTLLKKQCYPIKTHSMFFEKHPETMKPERKIDPMIGLMEHLAKLYPDEQIWLQITSCPIIKEIPWIKEGERELKKISKKIQKEWEVKGAEKGVSARPYFPPGELMSREQELISGIQSKLQKKGYLVWIRQLWIYKKNAPHIDGGHKIIRTYFMHFSTEHLNSIVFAGPTRCRIHHYLYSPRLYLRKRKQFRGALDRFPPLWPRIRGVPMWPHIPYNFMGPGLGIMCIVLNAEELATICHLPSRVDIPTAARIEAKKAGPPPSLPVS